MHPPKAIGALIQTKISNPTSQAHLIFMSKVISLWTEISKKKSQTSRRMQAVVLAYTSISCQ